MNNEIIDEFDEVSSGKLSPMINVLSILTFVYSGFMILVSIFYLSTIEKRTKEFNDAMDILESEKIPEIPFMDSLTDLGRITIENSGLIYSLEIIVAILCILGAIIMRKMLKNGFYLYMAATILYIAGGAYIFGFGFGILNYFLVSILFPILYGVNFKHLK